MRSQHPLQLRIPSNLLWASPRVAGRREGRTGSRPGTRGLREDYPAQGQGGRRVARGPGVCASTTRHKGREDEESPGDPGSARALPSPTVRQLLPSPRGLRLYYLEKLEAHPRLVTRHMEGGGEMWPRAMQSGPARRPPHSQLQGGVLLCSPGAALGRP